MLEEPAMFKPLSYSSEFVSIRQLLMLSTDNASFKAKTYEQAVQIYLCQCSDRKFEAKICKIVPVFPRKINTAKTKCFEKIKAKPEKRPCQEDVKLSYLKIIR